MVGGLGIGVGRRVGCLGYWSGLEGRVGWKAGRVLK